MDKITNIKKFLKEEGLEGIQAFNTRNWFGDPVFTIYKKDGVTIDHCIRYDYIEIFGLTAKEYSSLDDVLDLH